MAEWNTNSGERIPYGHGRFTVNGRNFDVQAGQQFDKAVMQIAKEAGLQGKFYVKWARNSSEALQFVDASNAPSTVGDQMVVSITPHSQGA